MTSTKLKIFLMLAFACGLTFAAQAQVQPPKTPRDTMPWQQGWQQSTHYQTAQQRVDRWGTDLNLTPEQRSKFLMLEQQADLRLDSLRMDKTTPLTYDRYVEFQRLHLNDQRALLTPEQATTFDRLRREREQKKPQNDPHKPGGRKD